MTAVALDNAYNVVNSITSTLIAKPTHHKKSISAIIDVIKLTTNEKSVEGTEKLLKTLLEIKEALPSCFEDYNQIVCKGHFDFVTEHLIEINSFLSFIKMLFDNGSEVEIDNDNMYDFLANVEKSQNVLTYISDYLTLIMKIQKTKAEPIKSFSSEELNQFIAA